MAKPDVDLGDDKRFPRELAPHTREAIHEWVFVSLTDINSRTRGVPPAFAQGVLGATAAALDGAGSYARQAGNKDLADALAKVHELFTAPAAKGGA